MNETKDNGRAVTREATARVQTDTRGNSDGIDLKRFITDVKGHIPILGGLTLRGRQFHNDEFYYQNSDEAEEFNIELIHDLSSEINFGLYFSLEETKISVKTDVLEWGLDEIVKSVNLEIKTAKGDNIGINLNPEQVRLLKDQLVHYLDIVEAKKGLESLNSKKA